MINARSRWVEMDGAANVRDLGGLATTGGRVTRYGRVLRADNLQGLSPRDVRVLLGEYALRHVVDLRSGAEVRMEGPGPLTRVPAVTIHHLSLFAEGGLRTDVAADRRAPRSGPADPDPDLDLDRVLPWADRPDLGAQDDRSVGHYLAYLADRADSVVGALRVMSRRDGSSVVHCAAGKDRTGVVCALALDALGVHREEIVADYAQSGDRLEGVLARLRASRTYAADVDSRPADSHRPVPAIMDKFLSALDERFGGTLGWLAAHGWTGADTADLRSRLLA